MLPIQFQYPEDRNGTNPTNRIVDERHTITPANGADFNFLIPRAAPYFENSMTVTHVASGTTLIKGIDWAPSYKFEAASNTAPYLQLYGAISLLTTAYDGAALALEYQTLGGAYVLDEAELTTVLANTVIDPRLTSWESVTLVPGVYLPEPHLHNVVDTVGYADLVAAITDFKDSYVIEATRIYQALLTHTQDGNNPHDTNLIKLGIERFQDVYLATIDNIESATPSELNYVSANVLKFYLSGLRDDLVNLFKMVGDKGDVAFYLGGADPLDMEPGQILNRVAVVNTAPDLTAQLAYRESFAEVFQSWRRIAFSGGNPEGTPGELTGWAYNPATDKVSSTINSSSTIALQSPDKVDGDYVFEVGLRSTNNDDDSIGVSLGLVQVGGSFGFLTAFRSATHPSQTTGGTASLRLTYTSASGQAVLAQLTDLVSYSNGWNGYNALGEVLLKVTRTGTVLTIETSDAGQPLAYTLTFDLASDPRTVPFTGPVNLGYASHSQTAASWTTYRRTGGNPVIVATHTSQVYRWNGTDYAVTAEALSDVILRGRFYQNPMTKRKYYGIADGSPLLISGNASAKDLSAPTAVLDRVAHVDLSSRLAVGNYIDHWSQNPSTGAMTYRGFTAKIESSGYDIRSGGTTEASLVWLGDQTKRHAAVRAESSGAIGFTNPSGALVAYLDNAGVFQHAGINRTSDARVKVNPTIVNYDDFDVDELDLFNWVWASDVRVPEHMWGKADSGVIAQQVAKYFPGCVSQNSETGLLTVDDAKLASHLSIIVLKKLKALESKE